MKDEKVAVLEVLIGHCRVLAKSKDPYRRIAASEVEIQLADQLGRLRAGQITLFPSLPMAAGFAGRAEDPVEGQEGGGQ
jgi:hypothetical protein